MPEPPTERQDALSQIVKDLERLKAEADAAGLSLLAYILDTALAEARDQLES